MNLDSVAYYVLVDLSIIVTAAWLIGSLCVRVGQPRVVGEILAGILLGPTLLGNLSAEVFPLEARNVLSTIGQIGLTLFMFLVGLAVDWSRVKGRVSGIAASVFGAFALPVAGGLAVAPLLWTEDFVPGFGTDNAPTRAGFGLMVAALLTVTALPVAVRIMQELGMEASGVGVVTIAAAASATVLMFLLVGTASDVATGEPWTSIVLRVVWTGLFLTVAIVVVRPAVAWLAQRWTDHQALVLGLGIMFIAAAVANRIGVNVIVGGFVAGSVMPDRERLSALFEGHLGWLTASVLLPVFLAYSGLNTDLGVLTAGSAVAVGVLTAVAVSTRLVGGILGGRAGGLSWNEAQTVGAVLNCRGLLVLVVGLVAVQAEVFTAQLQVGSVVVALVTTGMTGPLVVRVARSATGHTAVESV